MRGTIVAMRNSNVGAPKLSRPVPSEHPVDVGLGSEAAVLARLVKGALQRSCPSV